MSLSLRIRLNPKTEERVNISKVLIHGFALRLAEQSSCHQSDDFITLSLFYSMSRRVIFGTESRNMNKLIDRFNNSNTYLIISDYPEKSLRGEKNYGIAWHTKELLEPLAKKYGVQFVVLAEKGANEQPELYQNKKILVLRVFDSNHHSLYPTVLKWLNTFNKIKLVHVHSEFCANGGLINQILLIPFLFLIKITGKRINYFSHNVITSLNNIAPHLNLKKGSIIVQLLNMCLKYYYKSLNLLVDRFVVMDEVIFKRLSRFVNAKKITLMPFWIQKNRQTISQKRAKKILRFKNNDIVLLCFGFITYYKGADWIIRTFKELKYRKLFKNVHLVLAGGPAYSLKDRTYYKEYFEKVTQSVKKENRIRITGFVPEKNVSTYFAAADCVVFPYRGLIGGSATLTQTISYQKPFIVSQPMHELLENSDFKEILKKHSLKTDYLSFQYDHESFYQAFKHSRQTTWQNKVKTVLLEITEKRSISRWIINCYNELYRHHEYTKKTIAKAKLSFSG